MKEEGEEDGRDDHHQLIMMLWEGEGLLDCAAMSIPRFFNKEKTYIIRETQFRQIFLSWCMMIHQNELSSSLLLLSISPPLPD